MHISLIGLPGCGKSTIGRHLAKQWQMPFVDSDHAIEQELGCTIKDYFAAQGEAAFRDVEQQVLAQLLEKAPFSVISTGGGAVLRSQNREALKQRSTVFYLQSMPADIARRLRNDTTRPLMQGEDPLLRLQALLAVRAPLYEQTAHFVVDCARQSALQVGRKIGMQAELAGVVATSHKGHKRV